MFRWNAIDALGALVACAIACGCTRPADREKPASKESPSAARDAATADETGNARGDAGRAGSAGDGAGSAGGGAGSAGGGAGSTSGGAGSAGGGAGSTANGGGADDDAGGASGDASTAAIAPTVPTVPTVSTAKLGADDSKIAQVEFSGRTACARRADGAIRCWGSANAREVGSVVPYAIDGAPEAAGMHLAHGVLAVATRSGEIAIGPLAVPAQPALALVRVGEAIDVRVDSPGRAWALTRTGEVHRFQDGKAERKLINVIALSSREKDSLDALHRDGTVTTVSDGKAIAIKGIRDAENLFGTRCAHLKSGGVACWDTRGKSVAWKGPLNVVDRRSSAGNTCTLAGSGVACIGRNEAGQLGTGPGDDVGPKDVAKIIALPGKPTQIAGGDRAWCAVLDAGALACWGANDGGQLGDGTLIDRMTPVVIAGASSATAPAAPKRGEEPVAEADVAMGWHDLPKGCTKPATIPRPGGAPVNVVSAYAATGERAVDLWFADFKLHAGGYRDGHVVARGAQLAVVYRLGGAKVERGRFRGHRGSRTATVALRTLGAPAPEDADVLVEKVEDGWICGTILDPDDAKKRAPFAAKITKPRYGD